MPYKFDKLSILVVEDNQAMLEVVTNTLKLIGVGQVYQARNGEQGYQVFTRERPDVIITDWEMDPVDGLEMVKWIRRNTSSPKRNVPVIVMTGYAASVRVAVARDKGITEFLVKPFTANELARRIAYVIDHPRDFVETQEFFGPDRRRRRSEYNGPDRRQEDDD
ncbi:MAG: response regulator [Rhodospirillales bacterium]|nr:response regulator [Alphaproteobacteria bacterium]MCB9986027.1 response regulator [Rhodospirillales bacterium]USO07399.1 MAG: response regulator [Rhodospirillales bacterium]